MTGKESRDQLNVYTRRQEDRHRQDDKRRHEECRREQYRQENNQASNQVNNNNDAEKLRKMGGSTGFYAKIDLHSKQYYQQKQNVTFQSVPPQASVCSIGRQTEPQEKASPTMKCLSEKIKDYREKLHEHKKTKIQSRDMGGHDR